MKRIEIPKRKRFTRSEKAILIFLAIVQAAYWSGLVFIALKLLR